MYSLPILKKYKNKINSTFGNPKEMAINNSDIKSKSEFTLEFGVNKKETIVIKNDVKKNIKKLLLIIFIIIVIFYL